jgi:hypothetical protein
MRTVFSRILSLGGAFLVFLVGFAGQAHAVNVSVGIGGEVLPGVYGSVNIDNGRYPVLVYDEPLIVTRPARIGSPVYLHVPPGHLKKWGRYCGRYDACARPVYFARSRDYYDFRPSYIEQRYVYRDRITFVDRGGYERGNYYDRKDRYYRQDDRWDDRRRDYNDDRKHWKHEHRGNGRHHGNGRHGRDD